jgi:type IV pilus assembly protein PilB
MVGEIRDLATADIAIKASQTGHLVLSTLHTNDAPSTLARLSQMGIAGFNLASSVSLVCAQRLLRRLCMSCKQPMPDNSGYRAIGCHLCLDGYKGRIAIHQVMPITHSLQLLMLQQASAIELAQQAQRRRQRLCRLHHPQGRTAGSHPSQSVLADRVRWWRVAVRHHRNSTFVVEVKRSRSRLLQV